MASVLVTVSGPDKPGVTGVLFTALSAHHVEVLDVDQVVIRGALTLGVLVATPGDPEALQEHVEQAMHSLGMRVSVAIDRASRLRAAVRHAHRRRPGPAVAGQGNRSAGQDVR